MSNEINMDSLLDGTLDDLADMPEYKPYPAGTHDAVMTIEQKMINNHPSFIVHLKAVETVELANPQEDTPLEKDASTDVSYMMDNEMGQGGFKELLKVAAEKFGSKSNRDLIADMQNATVRITTKVRANKDKSQFYTSIVEAQFH